MVIKTDSEEQMIMKYRISIQSKVASPVALDAYSEASRPSQLPLRLSLVLLKPLQLLLRIFQVLLRLSHLSPRPS